MITFFNVKLSFTAVLLSLLFIFSQMVQFDSGNKPTGHSKWEVCNTTEKSMFRLNKPAGWGFVVSGDLNTPNFSSFLMFLEADNSTCPPYKGWAQGVSIDKRYLKDTLRARVFGRSWENCTVYNAGSLLSVLICPPLIKDKEYSLANIEIGNYFDSTVIKFCKKPVETQKKMAGCIAFALKNPVPKLLHEFVNYHLSIGFSHFFLYDRTSSLKSYDNISTAMGLNKFVTVRRWPGMTMIPQNILKCKGYYDQAVALAHCTWSARYKYQIVTLFDLDEWLVDTCGSKGNILNRIETEIVRQNSDCIVFKLTDIGGQKYNASKSVRDQFKYKAANQLGYTKAACIPHRSWGNAIHFGIPAPGFRQMKHQKSNLSLEVLHYRGIFRNIKENKSNEFIEQSCSP